MNKTKKLYLAAVFLLIFHSCAFANQNSKSKIDYTGLIDKREIEKVFQIYGHLPKPLWFFAIKELEEEKFIRQVSRGRASIYYCLNLKTK